MKFLAVVKHEYKKVVLKWSFLIGTICCRMAIVVRSFRLSSFRLKESRLGSRLRIERTCCCALKQNLSGEKIAERVRRQAQEAISNISVSQDEQLKRSAEVFQDSFAFVDLDTAGKSGDELRQVLLAKVTANEIDAFLIVPSDINDPKAVFEFRSRKSGDILSGSMFKDALNSAVRSVRLAGGEH